MADAANAADLDLAADLVRASHPELAERLRARADIVLEVEEPERAEPD